MTARAKTPPLVAAVNREITAINRQVPGTSRSADALLALELANRIVCPDVETLSARVSAARTLRETMAALHALVPAAGAQPVDGLAKILEDRERRLRSVS